MSLTALARGRPGSRPGDRRRRFGLGAEFLPAVCSATSPWGDRRFRRFERYGYFIYHLIFKSILQNNEVTDSFM